jgi:4a-hydroxytetrahydrobiopterin dehydratase
MPTLLTEQQIRAALADHPHWDYRDGALTRVVQAGTFAGGIDLVARVAKVADEMNHHPDIDIRWVDVTFRLSTHSEGGITTKDVELAGRIDGIADRGQA